MPPSRTKSQKAPTDFTGRQMEKLREQQAEEAKDRSQELTMATAEEQERIDNSIVDYSDPDHPIEIPAPNGFSSGEEEYIGNDTDVVDYTEVVDVEPGTRMVLVRINSDLKTNVGYGNYYNFEAGRKYKLPVHVADHLDEKGYVWH